MFERAGVFACPACSQSFSIKDSTRRVTRKNLRWWHIPSQINVSSCPHCHEPLAFKRIWLIPATIVLLALGITALQRILLPTGIFKPLFAVSALLACLPVILIVMRCIYPVRAGRANKQTT